MRLLIIGLSLMLLVISFCIINYTYIKLTLEDIATKLSVVEENVNNNNWQKAAEQAQSTLDDWTKNENYYMAVLWHQHIDDVSVAMNQLIYDIELRDKEEALDSIIEARTIIIDMIEMESLSIGNVL